MRIGHFIADILKPNSPAVKLFLWSICINTLPRGDKQHSLLGALVPDIGDLLLLDRIYFQVTVSTVLSYDHASIYLCARA